ncbi:MAG: thiol-disulfide oxidoreductase DCC [Planctomyces sp.]|nr:thiol-disulfide oxidoreductase DCC [Planctomyces sp.]
MAPGLDDAPECTPGDSAQEAAERAAKAWPGKTILFFDGNCGLCQRSVQFFLNRDKRGAVLYAPLQGATAAALVPAADRERLDSMVVAHEGVLYRHSTAALVLITQLGGAWKWLATLGYCVPRVLRDVGYRVVASNRYRMFGKADACRLPQPGERARFLD